MTTGWRAAQTLNTGNSPVTIQNPSPSARQWGIHVAKITLVLAGTQAAGTLLIADPVDSTVLWTQDIPASGTTFTREFIFSGPSAAWRDFKITGPTTTKVAVMVWYRP